MVDIKEKNGILIAGFTNQDRFNALIAEPVKETLMGYFRTPNTKMIIDLSGIKFIDSSGFSVFLSIMKAANNNYGIFKICKVNKEVMELFQVLQLHTIFEIHDSLEECIESFN